MGLDGARATGEVATGGAGARPLKDSTGLIAATIAVVVGSGLFIGLVTYAADEARKAYPAAVERVRAACASVGGVPDHDQFRRRIGPLCIRPDGALVAMPED